MSHGPGHCRAARVENYHCDAKYRAHPGSFSPPLPLSSRVDSVFGDFSSARVSGRSGFCAPGGVPGRFFPRISALLGAFRWRKWGLDGVEQGRGEKRGVFLGEIPGGYPVPGPARLPEKNPAGKDTFIPLHPPGPRARQSSGPVSGHAASRMLRESAGRCRIHSPLLSSSRDNSTPGLLPSRAYRCRCRVSPAGCG